MSAKCRSATRVVSMGIVRHNFGSQFCACLEGVDGFVFRAMIHKRPPHIGHETDRPDVADQKQQTNDSLNQIVEPGTPAKIMFQLIRQFQQEAKRRDQCRGLGDSPRVK